jgi:hypothetical protein
MMPTNPTPEQLIAEAREGNPSPDSFVHRLADALTAALERIKELETRLASAPTLEPSIRSPITVDIARRRASGNRRYSR